MQHDEPIDEIYKKAILVRYVEVSDRMGGLWTAVRTKQGILDVNAGIESPLMGLVYLALFNETFAKRVEPAWEKYIQRQNADPIVRAHETLNMFKLVSKALRNEGIIKL